MRIATRRQGKDAAIDWLHFDNHRRPHAMAGYLTFAGVYEQIA
ncbi:MAG: hypothetical protein ACRECP_06205 [Methylocella sp.]